VFRLTLIFILFCGPLYGVDPNYCEDMMPLVCSDQKTKDDGTGINKKIEIPAFELQKALDQLTNANKEKFVQILKDSQKSVLRQNLFKALPLKRKECPKADSLLKSDCAELFAKELAQIIDSENLSPENDEDRFWAVRDQYQKNLRNLSKILASDEYQTVKIDHQSAILKLNKNPEAEKKIREEIFNETQKAMLVKISELPLDDKIKSQMREKVQNTVFGGFDCPGERSHPTKLEILHNRYLPKVSLVNNKPYLGKNSIFMCRGFSSSTESEFSLIFALAHELTHPNDPCQFLKKSGNSTLAELDSQYPLANTLKCLRNSKSVGAQNKIEFCKTTNHKKENKCQELEKKTNHCPQGEGMPRDQIGESISDLLAAEITHDLVKLRHPDLKPEQWQIGVSQMLVGSTSCSNLSSIYDEHPADEKRINSLILANPKIRKSMGCPEKSPNKLYCDPMEPTSLVNQNSKESLGQQ
jgi:hypothetical protein